MCPSSANSSTSTRGSAPRRRRATPRADSVVLPADQEEHRHVQRAKRLQRCRLGEERMGPAANVDGRGGDRLASRLGHLLPGAFAHPVVDERFGGPIAIAAVEGERGVGHRLADAVGGVRWRRLGVDEREQGRLVQHQAANACRLVQGRPQRDRRAVGVADQGQRRAGVAQHRLDQRDLVGKADLPVGRPFGALAGAVRVGCEDAKARRKKLHQPAPLARAARVRVQADDAGAAAGVADEGQGRGHQPTEPAAGE